jgi:hypothetical protein
MHTHTYKYKYIHTIQVFGSTTGACEQHNTHTHTHTYTHQHTQFRYLEAQQALAEASRIALLHDAYTHIQIHLYTHKSRYLEAQQALAEASRIALLHDDREGYVRYQYRLACLHEHAGSIHKAIITLIPVMPGVTTREYAPSELGKVAPKLAWLFVRDGRTKELTQLADSPSVLGAVGFWLTNCQSSLICMQALYEIAWGACVVQSLVAISPSSESESESDSECPDHVERLRSVCRILTTLGLDACGDEKEFRYASFDERRRILDDLIRPLGVGPLPS